MKRQKKLMIVIVAIMIMVQSLCVGRVFADEEVIIDEGDIAMSVSPMRENIVLNPGDEYHSSFSVTNPAMALQDLYYRVDIQPFSVNENYDFVYDEINSSTQIADWITIESGERGSIHPNETAVVKFIVKVPEDAPAGGQYASLTVSTDFEAAGEAGININEAMSIAYLVLGEITGDTIYGGSILETGIDSFSLGKKIRTYSTVQNTGNVHALATYKIRITSIFSDEVLYSNEDLLETHYVLPNTDYYDETIWDDTPMIGIFNVSYIVEFQGLKSEVSKMVIVCPWWMLIIIMFVVLILILRIATLVALKRHHKKSRGLEGF